MPRLQARRLSSGENGNVFFYILLGIALFALLSLALMNNDNIKGTDEEQMMLALSQIDSYAGELRQAVRNVIDNGASEADIRFAHPSASADYGDITVNPEFQIFAAEGGAATYRTPPAVTGSTEKWMFTGSTKLSKGSSKADLLAVIPNVSKEFCDFYNKSKGLDITTMYPEDVGSCLMPVKTAHMFVGNFSGSPNALGGGGSFSSLPAPRACVKCTDDSAYYVYVTLYER